MPTRSPGVVTQHCWHLLLLEWLRLLVPATAPGCIAFDSCGACAADVNCGWCYGNATGVDAFGHCVALGSESCLGNLTAHKYSPPPSILSNFQLQVQTPNGTNVSVELYATANITMGLQKPGVHTLTSWSCNPPATSTNEDNVACPVDVYRVQLEGLVDRNETQNLPVRALVAHPNATCAWVVDTILGNQVMYNKRGHGLCTSLTSIRLDLVSSPLRRSINDVSLIVQQTEPLNVRLPPYLAVFEPQPGAR